MRARDKPSFPIARVDGTYGCPACGTYHRLVIGVPLVCHFCRTALPLIYVTAAARTDGLLETPPRR